MCTLQVTRPLIFINKTMGIDHYLYSPITVSQSNVISFFDPWHSSNVAVRCFSLTELYNITWSGIPQVHKTTQCYSQVVVAAPGKEI